MVGQVRLPSGQQESQQFFRCTRKTILLELDVAALGDVLAKSQYKQVMD